MDMLIHIDPFPKGIANRRNQVDFAKSLFFLLRNQPIKPILGDMCIIDSICVFVVV